MTSSGSNLYGQILVTFGLLLRTQINYRYKYSTSYSSKLFLIDYFLFYILHYCHYFVIDIRINYCQLYAFIVTLNLILLVVYQISSILFSK